MAFAGWPRVEKVSDGGHAEIGGRRIYILPSRHGVVFGVLLFLMLLGSVNYGNNPAHLLTFLLGAVASNAIYLTWRNLRGLRLDCRGAPPSFAGRPASLVLELDGGDTERPAIQIGLEDGEPMVVDVAAGGQGTRCVLELDGLPRGEHPIGRLRLSTLYPLGLFRAWCYVDSDQPILVYPRVGPAWSPHGLDGQGVDGEGEGAGHEDFAGLRGYLPGDPASRIDWKSFARDRGLNTRLFSGLAPAPVWLEWDQAPGADTEARLSALTRAVLDTEAAGRAYGLRTPQQTIEPSFGPHHRHQCLRHLALYGWGHA